MLETRDIQTCLRDSSQAWGIACSHDPIYPQVVVGVVMSTIIIMIILLQEKVNTILREIRKR